IRSGSLTDHVSMEVLNTVVTCERLDTFFVFNNVVNGFVGFTSMFGINHGRSSREVVENILKRKNELLPRVWSGQLKVDYIVFHNLVLGATTVACVRDDKPR